MRWTAFDLLLLAVGVLFVGQAASAAGWAGGVPAAACWLLLLAGLVVGWRRADDAERRAVVAETWLRRVSVRQYERGGAR